MPAYVSLYNFTDQGIRNIKGTVDRVKSAKAAAEAAGVRVIGIWWTMGPYDLVAISEGPEEAVTRFQLGLGMVGNVRSMSMRAFGEEEMPNIIQGLP